MDNSDLTFEILQGLKEMANQPCKAPSIAMRRSLAIKLVDEIEELRQSKSVQNLYIENLRKEMRIFCLNFDRLAVTCGLYGKVDSTKAESFQKFIDLYRVLDKEVDFLSENIARVLPVRGKSLKENTELWRIMATHVAQKEIVDETQDSECEA